MKLLSFLFLSGLLLTGCRTNGSGDGSEILAAETGVDTWQYKRFGQWIDILETAFRAADGDETVAAKGMLGGNVRIASFNLQALGRLYTNLDPVFTEFQDDFKKLEDGVGKVDMWTKVGDTVKRQEAFDGLVNLLKKKAWVKKKFKESRLAEHKEFLKKYVWMSYKKDRKALVDQLRAQVQSIMIKTYDMALLEDEGTGAAEVHGVHELRRELRWYLIETRVLNGMVQFRDSDNNCPVSFYQDLPTTYQGDPKYTTLPPNEPKDKACLVARCLFLAVNKQVDALGKVKDAAEGDAMARQTNRVPPALQLAAQQVFDEITLQNLTTAIDTDFSQCGN